MTIRLNSRPSIRSLSSPRRPVRRQLIHDKSIAESNQDFKELAFPESDTAFQVWPSKSISPLETDVPLPSKVGQQYPASVRPGRRAYRSSRQSSPATPSDKRYHRWQSDNHYRIYRDVDDTTNLDRSQPDMERRRGRRTPGNLDRRDQRRHIESSVEKDYRPARHYKSASRPTDSTPTRRVRIDDCRSHSSCEDSRSPSRHRYHVRHSRRNQRQDSPHDGRAYRRHRSTSSGDSSVDRRSTSVHRRSNSTVRSTGKTWYL